MKKIVKNFVCILLILTLSASTALLAYLHFFGQGSENLSGEWTAELDMTGQAAVTAYVWLRDIEAVSVSLEELEDYMQDLTIQVNLTFEQTSRQGGTFYSAVQTESYEACSQAAYEAFAEAFRALLVQRLHMAGFEDGTDREAAEALVMETFGMSTESYLMACGPVLLPSLEELQAWYDGSGSYETAEGILIRRFEAGDAADTKEEGYIRKGSSLILSNETGASDSGGLPQYYPMMYTLKQPAGR